MYFIYNYNILLSSIPIYHMYLAIPYTAFIFIYLVVVVVVVES